MRALHFFNSVGVFALALLCGFQWHVNRNLNLRFNALDKLRLEQAGRLADQDEKISSQVRDLDSFREHIQRATSDLKIAESNTVACRREAEILASERDQLRAGIDTWKQAVTERDQELSRAAAQIEKLAADRNDAVKKFNELAAKHNTVVEDLNTRTREFNSLIERYNALAKSNSHGVNSSK